MSKIAEILDECGVCRIAVNDKDGLYIFPINYGYTLENDKLTLYFHSAKEGRKVSAAAKKCPAAFEADCGYELIKPNHGDPPCTYSCKYKSILGNGTLSIIDNKDEAKKALSVIVKHLSKEVFEFDDKAADTVAVLKLEVSEFTAKAKL